MNGEVARASHAVALLLGVLFLTGCGKEEDGSDGGGGRNRYVCTIPCLADSPSVSTSTVSSATGGIVDVTFTLTGNVAGVSISLDEAIPGSANKAGIGSLENVSGGIPQTIAIVVNAGTAPGFYYPFIGITASPLQGSWHYFNPVVSLTKYSYMEIVNFDFGQTMRSPFTIPFIEVQ